MRGRVVLNAALLAVAVATSKITKTLLVGFQEDSKEMQPSDVNKKFSSNVSGLGTRARPSGDEPDERPDPPWRDESGAAARAEARPRALAHVSCRAGELRLL